MRVYLDNCCCNRPFDPQTDLRISLETAAKMRVQALMRSGEVEYVWSDALDYELNQSPIRCCRAFKVRQFGAFKVRQL